MLYYHMRPRALVLLPGTSGDLHNVQNLERTFKRFGGWVKAQIAAVLCGGMQNWR